MRSAAVAAGSELWGEGIRAEKGAWRREPYLMEQPGSRLRHAGEKWGIKAGMRRQSC